MARVTGRIVVLVVALAVVTIAPPVQASGPSATDRPARVVLTSTIASPPLPAGCGSGRAESVSDAAT